MVIETHIYCNVPISESCPLGQNHSRFLDDYLESEKDRIFDNTTHWFLLCIIFDYSIQIYRGKSYLYKINDSITSILTGFSLQIVEVMSRSFMLRIYWWVHINFAVIHLDGNSIWIFLLELFVVDFLYYCAHRCAHGEYAKTTVALCYLLLHCYLFSEINLLWSVHQVHHSSEYYNLAVAVRQSFVMHLFNGAFYIPEMLFFPPQLHMMHYSLNLLYQFFIHTTLCENLGPLELLLNTPAHHRVHHGRNAYAIDKNYGGIFIIWDRLFGTFEKEKVDEPLSYGLVTNIRSFDQFYLQCFYFKALYDKFRNAQGLGNKFKSLFFGPGWLPGKPRLGELSDVPPIDQKYVKYNTLRSRMIIPYLVLNGASPQLAYEKLFLDHKTMNYVEYFMTIVYLFASIQIFSLLLNSSSQAWRCELMRIIATFMLIPYFASVHDSIILTILQAVSAVSIFVALCHVVPKIAFFLNQCLACTYDIFRRRSTKNRRE